MTESKSAPSASTENENSFREDDVRRCKKAILYTMLVPLEWKVLLRPSVVMPEGADETYQFAYNDMMRNKEISIVRTPSTHNPAEIIECVQMTDAGIQLVMTFLEESIEHVMIRREEITLQ